MNRATAATVACLVLATAACGPAPTRYGTTADPATIRSVYGTGFGAVGTDVLDSLVAVTADQSVTVARPRPSAGRAEEEFDALDLLASGDADLTVVRAGALALRGAHSLAVLQTPLLVTSPEHADAVARNALSQDLMADLGGLGLTGLAMVPGGVRHPFGYGRALYGAEDYRGVGFSSGPANGVDPLVEALGAHPDHSVGADRRAHIAAGELSGIEASLLQPGPVDLPAVLTSNVSLYTKFDVVVIRKDAWKGFNDAQRQVLRAAVTEAGRQAEAARGDESAALDRWCATPQAASVKASEAQVASIATALAPAIAEATSDPRTRDLAARVAALGVGTQPPAGKICGSVEIGTTNEDFLVPRTGDQSVLDGVWRIDAAYQDFVDAGVGVADARANAGVWTLTIQDHLARVDQPNGGSDCAWDFYVDGDRVSLDLMYGGNDACWGLAVGTWHRDGDVVRFRWDRERYYDVAIDNAMFARGMHRIR